MATRVYNVYRSSDEMIEDFVTAFHGEGEAQTFIDEQDFSHLYTFESSYVWDNVEEYRAFLRTGKVDVLLRAGDKVRLNLLGEEVVGTVGHHEGEQTPTTWLQVRTEKGSTLRQVKDLHKI